MRIASCKCYPKLTIVEGVISNNLRQKTKYITNTI